MPSVGGTVSGTVCFSRESRFWARRLPVAPLMPVAALAVHQLRYLLAYGPKGSSELAATGHSYLDSLTPWLVLLLALGVGGFLGRLARAWRAGEDGGPQHRGALGVWLAATAGLILIYAGQEFLEGLFATGHPAGLAGIFGHGGLWALPAALAVGAVLALLVRGGRAAIAFAARLGRARPRGRRRLALARRPAAPVLIPPSPLAACSAGRAPPFGC
jgi:hypothetical protein